jgi:hypothetical protein
VENQKLEVRSEESGARSQELEAGGQRPEARAQRADVRSQQLEVGNRKPEPSGQKPDSGAEPTEDSGEEAEMPTKIEGNLSTEATYAPPPPDDDGYVWPEGAEASAQAEGLAPTAPAAEAPLPSLDELVKRIPAEVRETLDDLFRVKYVSVKRISPSSLKG